MTWLYASAMMKTVMAVAMAATALAAGAWALARERRDPASGYAEDPAALAHGSRSTT